MKCETERSSRSPCVDQGALRVRPRCVAKSALRAGPRCVAKSALRAGPRCVAKSALRGRRRCVAKNVQREGTDARAVLQALPGGFWLARPELRRRAPGEVP